MRSGVVQYHASSSAGSAARRTAAPLLDSKLEPCAWHKLCMPAQWSHSVDTCGCWARRCGTRARACAQPPWTPATACRCCGRPATATPSSAQRRAPRSLTEVSIPHSMENSCLYLSHPSQASHLPSCPLMGQASRHSWGSGISLRTYTCLPRAPPLLRRAAAAERAADPCRCVYQPCKKKRFFASALQAQWCRIRVQHCTFAKTLLTRICLCCRRAHWT